jgi:hypothetical protein
MKRKPYWAVVRWRALSCTNIICSGVDKVLSEGNPEEQVKSNLIFRGYKNIETSLLSSSKITRV